MNQATTSKDEFFSQIGKIADAMVAAHGKEFAMGAMVLAARFIAEGTPPPPDAPGATPDPARVISSRVS